MKIKSADLIEPALSWAVAVARGDLNRIRIFAGHTRHWVELTTTPNPQKGGLNSYRFEPSTDWSVGGPIIEREKIELRCYTDGSLWYGDKNMEHCGSGPTALIAAMRCYVNSKLGDEVEIPEELFRNCAGIPSRKLQTSNVSSL